MAGYLSDEIIKISFNLSKTVSLPQPYRRFAWVSSNYLEEEKLILDIANYKNNLEKFDEAGQEYVNLWFATGGQYLSVYKYTPEVTIQDPDFSVTPASASIKIGETKDFTIAVTNGLKLSTISAKSSDTAVATVVLANDIATITAVAEGSCKVNVESSEIDKVVELDVTISATGKVKIINKTKNSISGVIPATQLKDLDIVEGIVILAGNTYEEQIKMYKSASESQKEENTGKFWVLSIEEESEVVDELKAVRGIHLMMVGESSGLVPELIDKSVFDFYAPYTQKDYYRQNSFINSAVQGIKLKTLQGLKKDNVGALVWWEEFSENNYYNICDTKGYTFNANILRKDLETKIKEAGLKQLKTDNAYNQDLISMLEKIIGDVAQSFKNKGLVGSFRTGSLAFKKQAEVDIKNKLIKGFELTYQVLLEAIEIEVEINEQLVEVENSELIVE